MNNHHSNKRRNEKPITGHGRIANIGTRKIGVSRAKKPSVGKYGSRTKVQTKNIKQTAKREVPWHFVPAACVFGVFRAFSAQGSEGVFDVDPDGCSGCSWNLLLYPLWSRGVERESEKKSEGKGENEQQRVRAFEGTRER